MISGKFMASPTRNGTALHGMAKWKEDIQLFHNIQTVQAICYTPIVILGVIGNCYVIAMIVRVFRTSKVRAGVYVYVLCLSLFDLAFLGGSTCMVLGMYFHTWICGQFLCKVYWMAETFNKTYSVYILVLLSVDRYRAISNISEYETRNYKAALKVIFLISLPICLTNLPIYIHSTLAPATLPENKTVLRCHPAIPDIQFVQSERKSNGTVNVTITITTINYYIKAMFVLYFVIPCSFIISAYTLLLLRLRRPQHTSGFASANTAGSHYIQRRISRGGKVVKSILVVVAFYLVCWTPYWIMQLILVIHGMPKSFHYVQAVIYSLPYVNSGLNPILYGFLNRSLRRAYRDSIHRLRNRRLTKGDLSASLKRRRVYRTADVNHYNIAALQHLFPGASQPKKWRRLYSRVCRRNQLTVGCQTNINTTNGPIQIEVRTEHTTEYGRPENTDSGVYDVWANHRGSLTTNAILHEDARAVKESEVERWLLYFTEETFL